MMRIFIALLLCSTGGPAWAENTGPGLTFQHHDWELNCDNTGTCRAAGFQADGPPVSVLLTREAGPNARITGEFAVGDNLKDKDGKALPQKFLLAMRIDGRSFGTVESANGPMNPRQVAALLTSIKGDGRIEFSYRKMQFRLSAKGATAVLLKMDDYQRRIAKRSMPVPVMRLAAVAPAQASDILLASAKKAPLIEALRRADPQSDCKHLAEDADAPLTVLRLSAAHLLVSGICDTSSARALAGYWVIEDVPGFNPVLVTTEGEAFNSSGAEIRINTHGAGMNADCLGYQTWHWDGKQFIMTNWAQSGGCGRGLATGGVWSMPRLVTKVVESAP